MVEKMMVPKMASPAVNGLLLLSVSGFHIPAKVCLLWHYEISSQIGVTFRNEFGVESACTVCRVVLKATGPWLVEAHQLRHFVS